LAPVLSDLWLPAAVLQTHGCPCLSHRCRTPMGMAPLSRSAGIDPGPGGGPHPHADAHRGATGRPAGRERLRGLVRCGLALAGVSLPDPPAEGRGREGTAGMEQAAVADCHEAVRPDMREEPAETLSGVTGRGAAAGTAHGTGGASHRAVCEADEPMGGAGDLADLGGQGGEGGGAGMMGLPVAVPGAGPDLWLAVLQPSGRAQGGCEARAGEGGERCDRDKAGGSGGAPGRAVRCAAPARDEGVAMGVVLALSAPGVQDPGAPREGCPNAARVGGQPLAGHGRRLQHGVVRETLRRAETGTPGLRAGAGAADVRPWALRVQVVLEPLLGLMLLALGTVPVATGRMDAVWPPTGWALREAVAGMAAVAPWDGAADRAVCGGERGVALQGRWRTGGEARAAGGQGSSPCLRALRRSEASSCPVWVRSQEPMGVSSWGCPRERWIRRGLTPASRRWVAEECRRVWMATPILVIPARYVAVRKAPGTLERRMGAVAGALCW